MSTAIYYFTGTGNSLAAARTAASCFTDSQVKAVADAKGRQPVSNADIIGIVYPVFAFGMPNMVATFLHNAKFQESAYIFAICTYAGMQGHALQQAAAILAGKNLVLQAGCGVKMPSNYTPFFKLQPESEQQKILTLAHDKIIRFCASVKNHSRSKLDHTPLLPRRISNYFYRKVIDELALYALKLRVNEHCNGCGTCAALCPAGNIKIKNGKPVWEDHCEGCLACFHWCPQKAIVLPKDKSGGRRYHHPDITLHDMMQK